jgi:2,4-dienoyl-CoA reductase-like NADH-dependent reductase (Old Yellow Enzyme family)
MPLGARITGTDWVDGGLTADDAVATAKALKAAGLDYIDVSSANITPDSRWPSDPGFNVPIAERVRREAGIATRAVGMIAGAKQAEEIVASGKADMVAMARAFLDDPHWGWHAAQTLGAEVARPPQYARTAPKLWPGAACAGEVTGRSAAQGAPARRRGNRPAASTTSAGWCAARRFAPSAVPR